MRLEFTIDDSPMFLNFGRPIFTPELFQNLTIEFMAKVLIIDDDPDVRTVMDVLMKKHGYEVATASNREDALVKLGEFQPSVILLDVLLSGTDGRELCQEIKANDEIKHTPVIMFSAHPGAAENISSYGADDFISKPINTENLLEKLDRFVNLPK